MRKIYIGLLLLLFSGFCVAQGKDAALWAGMEFEKTIVKKVSGHIKFQGRLNDNFSHADYGFIDVGLSYKLNKYVRFTSAYVMNAKNAAEGSNWRLRQQWYGNVRLGYKWNNFSIANRNQLQTDLEDSRSSAGSWFYRNKTVVKYTLGDNWKPYVSYEMYFRLGFRPLHEGLIYRKRYSFGFEYEFSKNTSIQLGYLIQTQLKRKQPDEIYAVTVGFNHSFPGKLIDPKKQKEMKFRKY